MQRDEGSRESCQLLTLARNNVAHIQRCAHCGALAVHLGPVTLRFDQGALESLWSVLGQALARSASDERDELLAHAPAYARAGQA